MKKKLFTENIRVIKRNNTRVFDQTVQSSQLFFPISFRFAFLFCLTQNEIRKRERES